MSELSEQDIGRVPKRIFTGWPAALAILAIFHRMGLSASRNFCATADETAHITSGVRYWQTRDFFLQPENGNLPQRWAALPIVLGRFRPLPLSEIQEWNIPNVYYIGDFFFYHEGNKPELMLLLARGMIGLLSVGTGVVVYVWSRKLFGPTAGMLSLLLFSFCPMMLGHGFLATSDAAATLFFVLSLLAIWSLLHNFSLWRLAASCLAVPGLALSKYSAPLIAPITVILVLARLIEGSPLPVHLAGLRIIRPRWKQACLWAAVAACHLAVAVGLIWTFYCFRYDTYSAQSHRPTIAGVGSFLSGGWDWALRPATQITRIVDFSRRHHLLPEGYLYGFMHTIANGRYRQSFVDGYYHNEGTPWYFPYAMLVKTPLGLFGILLVAAVGAIGRMKSSPRLRGLYRTLPLWLLLLGYWIFAIPSHLNIGLRHIMPTFPALFILAGAALREAETGETRSWPTPAIFFVGIFLAWQVAASLWVRPYYMEYFNELIGGPSHGYQKLVDSNLDWGEDLPALKNYLDRALKTGPANVYLAYSGVGSPNYHQIPAHILPGFGTTNEERVYRYFALKGGIYCVSATLLQGIYTLPPGPWTQNRELEYWKARQRFENALEINGASDEKHAAYREYEFWRAARLFAYLRHRKPDAQAGYSILIYNLSDEEAKNAAFGPPQELSNDQPFGP